MLAQLAISATDPPIARIVGSAQTLPLLDGSVDLVTCGFGVTFFPDLPAALREMRRSLRAGGRLALTWWTRWELATPFTASVLLATWPMSTDPTFRGRAQELGEPGRLRELVRAAGFVGAREAVVSVNWGFDSFDAFWQHRAEGIARMASPPAAEEVDQYRARLAEVARPWTRTDGSLRYPLNALTVVAELGS